VGGTSALRPASVRKSPAPPSSHLPPGAYPLCPAADGWVAPPKKDAKKKKKEGKQQQGGGAEGGSANGKADGAAAAGSAAGVAGSEEIDPDKLAKKVGACCSSGIPAGGLELRGIQCTNLLEVLGV